MIREKEFKEIYLAGGCFWGVEAYMQQIEGVEDVISGYANGVLENPTYKQVCSGNTQFAETVKITYEPAKVSLRTLLRYYLLIIDPTSLNKQGYDIGTQYRTGIYYTDNEDLDTILRLIENEQLKYKKPVLIEVMPLVNFYPAEEYHQDYLDKNPGGYCHIDLSLSKKSLPIEIDPSDYMRPDDVSLRSRLNELQYSVTQESATERPFSNEFWNHHERGIYVDVVTGEPLFTSRDKFDSGCGWPSFVRPIHPEVLTYRKDLSHRMIRSEVRSRVGDSHLGHVFEDGPKEHGGFRFCINSAALEFIPIDKMEERGYGELISFVLSS